MMTTLRQQQDWYVLWFGGTELRMNVVEEEQPSYTVACHTGCGT